MTTAVKISILSGLFAGATAVAIKVVLSRRAGPEELERRRRLAIHQHGRIGDAMINEFNDNVAFYTYSIGGVQYSASQDLSALRSLLPADTERIIGPSGLKYAPKNPANSILICEDWNGLRSRPIEEVPSRVEQASLDRDGVGHQPQDAALAERPER